MIHDDDNGNGVKHPDEIQNQGIHDFQTQIDIPFEAGHHEVPQSDVPAESNEDFVKHAYQEILGRDADSGGAAWWTQALEHGASREEVVSGFQNSDEYKSHHAEPPAMEHAQPQIEHAPEPQHGAAASAPLIVTETVHVERMMMGGAPQTQHPPDIHTLANTWDNLMSQAKNDVAQVQALRDSGHHEYSAGSENAKTLAFKHELRSDYKELSENFTDVKEQLATTAEVIHATIGAGEKSQQSQDLLVKVNQDLATANSLELVSLTMVLHSHFRESSEKGDPVHNMSSGPKTSRDGVAPAFDTFGSNLGDTGNVTTGGDISGNDYLGSDYSSYDSSGADYSDNDYSGSNSYDNSNSNYDGGNDYDDTDAADMNAGHPPSVAADPSGGAHNTDVGSHDPQVNSSEHIAESLEQMYASELGRPADAEGLEHWKNLISNGDATLEAVQATFHGTLEHQVYASTEIIDTILDPSKFVGTATDAHVNDPGVHAPTIGNIQAPTFESFMNAHSEIGGLIKEGTPEYEQLRSVFTDNQHNINGIVEGVRSAVNGIVHDAAMQDALMNTVTSTILPGADGHAGSIVEFQTHTIGTALSAVRDSLSTSGLSQDDAKVVGDSLSQVMTMTGNDRVNYLTEARNGRESLAETREALAAENQKLIDQYNADPAHASPDLGHRSAEILAQINDLDSKIKVIDTVIVNSTTLNNALVAVDVKATAIHMVEAANAGGDEARQSAIAGTIKDGINNVNNQMSTLNGNVKDAVVNGVQAAADRAYQETAAKYESASGGDKNLQSMMAATDAVAPGSTREIHMADGSVLYATANADGKAVAIADAQGHVLTAFSRDGAYVTVNNTNGTATERVNGQWTAPTTAEDKARLVDAQRRADAYNANLPDDNSSMFANPESAATSTVPKTAQDILREDQNRQEIKDGISNVGKALVDSSFWQGVGENALNLVVNTGRAINVINPLAQDQYTAADRDNVIGAYNRIVDSTSNAMLNAGDIINKANGTKGEVASFGEIATFLAGQAGDAMIGKQIDNVIQMTRDNGIGAGIVTATAETLLSGIQAVGGLTIKPIYDGASSLAQNPDQVSGSQAVLGVAGLAGGLVAASQIGKSAVALVDAGQNPLVALVRATGEIAAENAGLNNHGNAFAIGLAPESQQIIGNLAAKFDDLISKQPLQVVGHSVDGIITPGGELIPGNFIKEVSTPALTNEPISLNQVKPGGVVQLEDGTRGLVMADDEGHRYVRTMQTIEGTDQVFMQTAVPEHVTVIDPNSHPTTISSAQAAAQAQIIKVSDLDPAQIKPDDLFRAQSSSVNAGNFNDRLPSNVDGALVSQSADGFGKASGDFVGVYKTADGQVQILVGDVAGHGHNSAVQSVRLQEFMADPANQALLARDGLVGVDAELGKTPGHVDAALSHIKLDPQTGQLQVTSVGDTVVYVVGHDGKVTEVPRVGPTMGYDLMGMLPDTAPTSIQLRPNDHVIAISDGIIDRFKTPETLAGQTLDAVKAELGQLAKENLTPQEIVDHLKGLKYHDPSMVDDSTAVAFQWKPPEVHTDAGAHAPEAHPEMIDPTLAQEPVPAMPAAPMEMPKIGDSPSPRAVESVARSIESAPDMAKHFDTVLTNLRDKGVEIDMLSGKEMRSMTGSSQTAAVFYMDDGAPKMAMLTNLSPGAKYEAMIHELSHRTDYMNPLKDSGSGAIEFSSSAGGLLVPNYRDFASVSELKSHTVEFTAQKQVVSSYIAGGNFTDAQAVTNRMLETVDARRGVQNELRDSMPKVEAALKDPSKIEIVDGESGSQRYVVTIADSNGLPKEVSFPGPTGLTQDQAVTHIRSAVQTEMASIPINDAALARSIDEINAFRQVITNGKGKP